MHSLEFRIFLFYKKLARMVNSHYAGKEKKKGFSLLHSKSLALKKKEQKTSRGCLSTCS